MKGFQYVSWKASRVQTLPAIQAVGLDLKARTETVAVSQATGQACRSTKHAATLATQCAGHMTPHHACSYKYCTSVSAHEQCLNALHTSYVPPQVDIGRAALHAELRLAPHALALG